MPEPAHHPALPAQHTVVAGDTLSGLAEHYYGHGDEAHWKLIYEANKAVIGADPNLIKPGEVLTIPAAPEPAPTEEA